MSVRPQLLRRGALDFCSAPRRLHHQIQLQLQPIQPIQQQSRSRPQQQPRQKRPWLSGCHSAAPFTTHGAQRSASGTIDSTASTASTASSSPSASTSSSTPSSSYSSYPDSSGRPRWTHTPERMKAPFSLQQPKDPRRSEWTVNEDPAKLDRMYERLLGRDLARSLPEELKWLAVTHKSFDNGRRGFNTRLAFFGRMIVALESTRAIMGSPAAGELKPDPFGREPFRHAALANVDKLAFTRPHDFTSPQKLVELTKDIGLPPVVRWKPRLPENLDGSGFTVVMVSTLYAIVGAVSLHHGADVASRMVEEKIIRRLGA